MSGDGVSEVRELALFSFSRTRHRLNTVFQSGPSPRQYHGRYELGGCLISR